MAGEPQGLMSFPGINQVVSGTLTLAHGRSPSVATLSIAPQYNWPAAGGTLSISFGGTTISFPDCKVDSANFTRNAGGQLVNLQILDRRWKWGWGWISGWYNVRNADGSVKEKTKKTPQQLAKLCLEAAGEKDYDVSQLPNQTEPEVNWDFAVPMEALAQLCDDLGCRIVLGLDNRVRLLPAGQGRTLDTSYILDQGATVNPPEKPDKLAVACSHVRYQVELELEAVAKETQFVQAEGQQEGAAESYVPLDKVSYKPAAGWKYEELPYWLSVTENSRPAAIESVLKTFRVKVPFNLPEIDPRAPKAIESLDQFELLDEKVEILAEGQDAEQVRTAPATVRGVYFPNKFDQKNNIDKLTPAFALNAEVDRDFQVVTDGKLVVFAEPIYRNTAADGVTDADNNPAQITVGPPTLRLKTSIVVRDPKTRAPIRYVRERATGSNFKTPTQFLDHEDIIVAVVTEYDDGYRVTGSSDNRASVDKEADHYLDAAEAEYAVENPQSVVYPGIVAVELDGAIGQVTWSVGLGGASTAAHRNTEQSRRCLPYKEKRRLQRQQAELRRLAKNAKDPLLNGKKPVRFV